MRFDKIIIVGSGKIACDCERYLYQIIGNEQLIALETQQNSVSMLETYCKRDSVAYTCVNEKDEIENWLLNTICNTKTALIISANNRFIFTPDIINCPGTEIINFHYALLPDYRGMNIPTWVIFNEEDKTGITWHFVTEQVDKGKLIDQREIQLSPDITAFDVTKQGMRLGIESFKSFISELLERHIDGKEIDYPNDDLIYYNKNLPCNGMIDINMSINKISALLRSFDYGRFSVVQPLKIVYNQKKYIVMNYQIKSCDEFEQRVVNYTNDKLDISENMMCVVIEMHEDIM